MKNLNRLAIALLAMVCTVLYACKKDKTEINSVKIKSITQTSSEFGISRTDLSYNAAGQLSESKFHKNGTLEYYTTYQYSGNNLKTTKSFIKEDTGVDKLQAEGTFTYQAGRLSKVVMLYNPSDPTPSTVTLTFDYVNGEIPKLTSETFPDFSSQFPEIPNPSVSDLKTGYSFDDQINPLKDLPIIMVLELAKFGDGIVTSHTFDPVRFFHAHNPTREDLGPRFPVITHSYTYNKKGLPVKVVSTSSNKPGTTQTVYEYW